MREVNASTALLAWYDAHARDLPWRIAPDQSKAGVQPDPYRVWLSEVMLQQTTVAAVKAYFLRFTSRWPSVEALATARDDDVMAEWAGLGYYARARNLLKCARVVAADHQGRFPRGRAALQALPGIGPYTSAAIAAIAFGAPETVVDGNVERVMARLFAVRTPLPAAKPALTRHAESLTPETRAGDYAQAVMDLGATVCTPRTPSCEKCPLQGMCDAHALGIAGSLPAKTPKKPKPTRRGVAYLVQRTDGAWLLERRPDKGLLGGMLGWPGSEWSDSPIPAPPLEADWGRIDGIVRHTFTHFHLELSLLTAQVGDNAVPGTGSFIANEDFDPKDLPTVMRKAFEHYIAADQQD